MSGTFTVNPVTQSDVETWWEWAFGINEGPTGNTPFKVGGGRFINTGQTKPFFCASCTAASGGRDLFLRRLPASSPGKDILIPIFVSAGVSDDEFTSGGACSEAEVAGRLLDKARRELRGGNDLEPTHYLYINEETMDIDRSFYFESRPFIKQIANPNSFGAPPGSRCIVSTGWFAKIQGRFDAIRFGGFGGQISDAQPEPFNTEVTYFT
jgi:hypothetical protein